MSKEKTVIIKQYFRNKKDTEIIIPKSLLIEAQLSAGSTRNWMTNHEREAYILGYINHAIKKAE